MYKKLFCLLAVIAIAGIANADVHLLAYYDFTGAMGQPTTQNEGIAGTAADGILMNGATIVDIDPTTRGVEHALNLDYGDSTVHQYMDIGKDWDPTSLEPLTIAAWIYVTPRTLGGWRTIMSKGYAESWCLAMGTPGAGDDKIEFSAHGCVVAGATVIGNVNVLAGYWYYVVGVVESETSVKLYIDGAYQGSSSCWTGVNNNEQNILIGDEPTKQNWDFQWNGMIDEIRIYDRALTEQDVKDLFVGTYRPIRAMSPKMLDINDDDRIDLGDFAIVASQWRQAPGVPSADFAPLPVGDGIVDIYDLGLLMENWLWE